MAWDFEVRMTTTGPGRSKPISHRENNGHIAARKEDLLDAASKNYLDLTEEELDGFNLLLQGIFSELEALDRLSSAVPAPVTGPRDFGQRPSPGKDPYNAILRRCMVKGSGPGKLSRVRVGLKDNISVSGMP